MWISPKMQKIGTSISNVNAKLITYPSIAVCPESNARTQRHRAYLVGQEPPAFPPTPNVGELVSMIRQYNMHGAPHDTVPSRGDLDDRDIVSHQTFQFSLYPIHCGKSELLSFMTASLEIGFQCHV